ncbi:hypothetical protein NDU88_008507 [Pleurodeles waltl]|uniref:Uncharacterized protein n=1 Tax=Pleurodeles waltl TaxID=8319 RepID=A0AAV7P593_PLEWA|nr:hypothetical protein NDU88_008507 [Pleurodeles waltl]
MRSADGLLPLAAHSSDPPGLRPHRNLPLPPAAGRESVVRGGHLSGSELGLRSGGVLCPFLFPHRLSWGVARAQPPSCALVAAGRTRQISLISPVLRTSSGSALRC